MWYNRAMALNLSPEYFEADRQYRQARTPAEKLAALEQMLRGIPKHKGSEKKQADLKRQISELRRAAQTRKKGGTQLGGGKRGFFMTNRMGWWSISESNRSCFDLN